MRHVIATLFVLLGCSRPEVVPEEIVAEPPAVPEECQPWKPGPEAREVPVEENPEIDGERRDRFVCYRREDGRWDECQAFANINLSRYVRANLWQKDDAGERAPYGTGLDCPQPWTLDTVTCKVELTDTNYNQVGEVMVACPGDQLCEDCCREVRRRKVFVRYVEPTVEERARWEAERCGRLRERRQLCEPFCRPGAPKASECAYYWSFTCPGG